VGTGASSSSFPCSAIPTLVYSPQPVSLLSRSFHTFLPPRFGILAWIAAGVLAVIALGLYFVHFREQPAERPLPTDP
jgi:hypothetical protein